MPLYYQIYLQLKRRIVSGEIPYGDRVAGEAKLAEAYSVSRVTTKRALDKLAADGLIERKRAIGSIVIYRGGLEHGTNSLTSVLDRLSGVFKNSVVSVLDMQRVVAAPGICDELKAPAGEKVLFVKRLRSDQSGRPFAYCQSWTRNLPRGVTKRDLLDYQRYDLITNSGQEIHRIEQVIGCTALDSTYVADLLGTLAGDPVLTLERSAYDARGDVIDVLRCDYHPERFQYRTVFDGQERVGAPEVVDEAFV